MVEQRTVEGVVHRNEPVWYSQRVRRQVGNPSASLGITPNP